MLYFNIKEQSEQRERLNSLRNALGGALGDAYIAFNQALQQNETREDRAVTIHEKLFDQALDALIAAWDGEPAELVECLQDRLGIKIPLLGKLVDDGHGKYTIEWGEVE